MGIIFKLSRFQSFKVGNPNLPQQQPEVVQPVPMGFLPFE
jgi:hypothetical protein